jgi:hypothetical protein
MAFRKSRRTCDGSRAVSDWSSRQPQGSCRYRTSPSFKVFTLNRNEAFFGFYPVVTHSVVIPDGGPVEIYDAMGKDAVLFRYAQSEDDTAIGTQYVDEAQRWFDSVWNSVAREYAS